MSQAFIGYNHVYHLGKPEVEGYLNGHVKLEPKVDGSNSSIYYDSNNEEFVVQSRKRTITPEKDNAGFANYMLNSDDKVPTAIREFCMKHPYTCVYGEWIGGIHNQKFLGTLKYYLHGGFFVFDIRDVNHKFTDEFVSGHYGFYTPDDEIYNELKAQLDDEDGFNHMIPVIAELDNPTEEQILDVIAKCHWNIPDNQLEEGVVLKNYEWVDKYQHHQFSKIVLKEYLEKKKHNDKSVVNGNIDCEQAIANDYLLEAKMEKTRNKVEIKFGGWEDDSKHIGCFLGFLWDDFINEDFDTKLLKKYKNPVIDFAKLKKIIQTSGRKFLGLI